MVAEWTASLACTEAGVRSSMSSIMLGESPMPMTENVGCLLFMVVNTLWSLNCVRTQSACFLSVLVSWCALSPSQRAAFQSPPRTAVSVSGNDCNSVVR